MSEREPAPTRDEWRALYDATLRFRALAPWEWMADSDLFGVQDPESGEIGYCCVMGAAGEHYALAVYRGSEGLAGYEEMLRRAPIGDPLETLMLQDCLMASFEDRDFITKEDYAVIRDLGHRFRGRNAWPLFRSYQPGYDPWSLTGSEARSLTVALDQAIDVAGRFREDYRLLYPRRRGYLVRVPEGPPEDRRWRDVWMEPAPVRREEIVPPPLDGARLHAIRSTAKRVRAVWEVDYFWMPGRIRGEDGGPDWYPQACLYVDQQMGLPLGVELFPAGALVPEFAHRFLNLLDRHQVIPSEVQVRREEAQALLEPVAEQLGFRLKRVDRLPNLEAMRTNLSEYLGGGF
jgi:hypothetical protein